MALTKHTAAVNIYLKQKATCDEIYLFIQTINKRLAQGFSGEDTSTVDWSVLGSNPDGLSPLVISHIHKREKFSAVKQHKDETGLGLREAKDCVERYCEINKLGETWAG